MHSVQWLKFMSLRISFSSLFGPIFIFVLTSAFIVIPNVGCAADFAGSLKGVTITDSAGENSPPTAVISSAASGDTVSFDAGASSDTDGTIVEYTWNFGDGNTGKGVTTSHTYSETGMHTVTLSVKDDAGGVALAQVNVETGATSAPINIAVNFQPATAPVPTGFVVDSGGSFDDTAGYGWTGLPNSYGARDRDKSISPDQSYDTMIHADPATGVWEVALPNGSYQVTICLGDAQFNSGLQSAQAEGDPVISNVELNGGEWAEETVTVNVTDGRLTVTFTGSNNPVHLCWIKISN